MGNSLVPMASKRCCGLTVTFLQEQVIHGASVQKNATQNHYKLMTFVSEAIVPCSVQVIAVFCASGFSFNGRTSSTG